MRSAGRGGSRVMRMMGISKGGIKAGRFISGLSLAVSPILPCWTRTDGKIRSPVGMLMHGANATTPQPLNERAMDALRLWGHNIVGYAGGLNNNAAPFVTGTKGICGVGILTGVGVTVAGKFANPLLAGSPVKF